MTTIRLIKRIWCRKNNITSQPPFVLFRGSEEKLHYLISRPPFVFVKVSSVGKTTLFYDHHSSHLVNLLQGKTYYLMTNICLRGYRVGKTKLFYDHHSSYLENLMEENHTFLRQPFVLFRGSGAGKTRYLTNTLFHK